MNKTWIVLRTGVSGLNCETELLNKQCEFQSLKDAEDAIVKDGGLGAFVIFEAVQCLQLSATVEVNQTAILSVVDNAL